MYIAQTAVQVLNQDLLYACVLLCSQVVRFFNDHMTPTYNVCTCNGVMPMCDLCLAVSMFITGCLLVLTELSLVPPQTNVYAHIPIRISLLLVFF